MTDERRSPRGYYRHKWPLNSVDWAPSVTGVPPLPNERTRRQCLRCGLARVICQRSERGYDAHYFLEGVEIRKGHAETCRVPACPTVTPLEWQQEIDMLTAAARGEDCACCLGAGNIRVTRRLWGKTHISFERCAECRGVGYIGVERASRAESNQEPSHV